MARVLKKPGVSCKKGGCPGVVRDSVCTVCGPLVKARRKEHDQRRGSAARRGYGRNWQKVRDMHLAEFPLCVECLVEGKTVLATDVDHIVRRRDGGSDGDGNLQSLCHSHHSRKTRDGR